MLGLLGLSQPVLAEDMLLPASDMPLPLDAAGDVVVPDFAQWLRNPAYSGPIIFVQNPVAGSVIHGPQAVFVNLTATSAGGRVERARFRLDLLDLTPPVVTVELAATSQQLETPGGTPYFLAPSAVTPVMAVADGCDAEPDYSVIVNGAVHDGNPINSVGFHTVAVRATDQSGNFASTISVFQISERLKHSARVAVADYWTVSGSQGIVTAGVEVLVAGEAFASRDIHLGTVALWLTDESGRWLHAQPLTIAGGYAFPDDPFNYATAQATFEDCVWHLTFVADFSAAPLQFAPARIEIAGSGRHFLSEPFDFIVSVPAVISPNPEYDFIDIINGCGDPPGNPDPQPEPSCSFRFELVDSESGHSNADDWQVCPPLAEGAESSWNHDVDAYPETIDGKGFAIDACQGVSAATSGAALGSGHYKGWFEPPGCCSACEITVEAKPRFQVVVKVDPPAASAAAGKLAVSAGPWGIVAEGGLAIGDWGTVTLQLGGFQIPVSESAPQMTAIFSGNPPFDWVTSDCAVNVHTLTSAAVSVSANGGVQNPVGWADAKISDASLKLKVKGKCLDPEINELEIPVISIYLDEEPDP